ncbi:MAG: uridine kinase [Bacteroidota bacterium]
MVPLVIGIAGGSASGKTTVTDRILERIDRRNVVILNHDSYYRDLSQFSGRKPSEINFDHPHALETSLLVEHIQQLKRDKSVQQPVYDFQTYSRKPQWNPLQPRDVIIVEGILIFVEKQLRDLMNIKIFVDTDADERLLRRLRRDIVERGRSLESVVTQYVGQVKPMHLEFVEPSKRWADIIVPRGGENEVAIDMVVTKILSLMKK